MNTDFLSTFEIKGPEIVAIVGGGGKTSLMFALANALPGRVVTTTTTRIFASQIKLSPVFLTAEDAKIAEEKQQNSTFSAPSAVDNHN